MKFIDTFNEDDKKKLTKKAKLIYSVLKKGTITRSDGVKFSYELGDNMVPSIVDGEIELFAFITKIIERTYCPINEIAMSDLIMKKFEQFDIKVDLQIPKSIEIVKYQGKKPWELSEDAKLYTKEDPSEEKRVRTIFKALKKGVVKVQHPRTDEIVKFRYNIDNVSYKWEYYNMMEKQLTIVTDNFLGEGITIYCDDEDIVDKCTNNLESMSRNPTGFHLREMFVDKLKSKFDTFNVSIQVNKRGMKFVLDKPNEPINEEIDIDKERNRVKTVHKAIRKGIVNVSGTRYRYELPEEYTFHVVDEPHLQLTSIKFTFYNKDISEGGHGLPLKIWRIEGGKDVYLNKMLTGQDVGDISYNDEYGITTKSGVEYVNVKNKVRNRYRNFDINAIMTTPSDTVMVNENHEEYKEKQIKKGKTIYNALKKGTIGSNDPNEPRFSYVLSDDFSIDMNNLGILIFTDGIKIKELNRECNIVSTGYMQSKIRDRFEQFDIILTNRHLTSHDIEPWERPTINEEEDNNITEKDRKKIELIYGLFKRGKYTVEDILYNYVLPDEYWIYDRNETGELVVVLTMDPTQKMKLYAKIKKEDGNLYHREVPVQATQYASLYDDAKKRIKDKFERFNIEIVF